MQFSAVLTIFIAKTYLNSIFTSDLKTKIRKIFIATDLVSLNHVLATTHMNMKKGP